MLFRNDIYTVWKYFCRVSTVAKGMADEGRFRVKTSQPAKSDRKEGDITTLMHLQDQPKEKGNNASVNRLPVRPKK